MENMKESELIIFKNKVWRVLVINMNLYKKSNPLKMGMEYLSMTHTFHHLMTHLGQDIFSHNSQRLNTREDIGVSSPK